LVDLRNFWSFPCSSFPSCNFEEAARSVCHGPGLAFAWRRVIFHLSPFYAAPAVITVLALDTLLSSFLFLPPCRRCFPLRFRLNDRTSGFLFCCLSERLSALKNASPPEEPFDVLFLGLGGSFFYSPSLDPLPKASPSPVIMRELAVLLSSALPIASLYLLVCSSPSLRELALSFSHPWRRCVFFPSVFCLPPSAAVLFWSSFLFTSFLRLFS